MYGWHFASLALRQCGGEAWRRFREALRTEVIPNQRNGGPLNGSWDPLGVWGEDGGRLYSTALVLLTLQASYRYDAPDAEPWVVPKADAEGGRKR